MNDSFFSNTEQIAEAQETETAAVAEIESKGNLLTGNSGSVDYQQEVERTDGEAASQDGQDLVDTDKAKVKPEVCSVQLSEIKFDEDIYPRTEHDPATVNRYAECIDEIEARGNYISIASDGTLLDGRHRHLGYLKKGNGDDMKIPVFRYPVESDADKFALAVELNSSHGLQLSSEDKRQSAVQLYAKYRYPIETVAKLVSVRKATALEWTRPLRGAEKQSLRKTVFDKWLACHTVEEIAEAIGKPAGTVKRYISEDWFKKFPGTKRTKLSKFEDFEEEDGLRPIYTVWNLGKDPSSSSHFGKCHPAIIERLLYLYTAPYDIVVDPFAGGGTVIDVCK